MNSLIDTVYLKLRKKEIEKANVKFKRMKVDTVLQSMTKACWKYSIQYEIIIKTKDTFIIKLIGNSESRLLKYHNTDRVGYTDIESFRRILNEIYANKGIYITTGIIDKNILRIFKNVLDNTQLVLEDNFHFIKRQIGLNGDASSIFIDNKLNFLKYFPR